MTRDEKGRFAKGTSGNPGGRPKDEAARLMREAISNKLDKARAESIAEQLLAKAEGGDLKAVEQLFRFFGLFEDKIDMTVKAPGLEEVLRRVYGS